MSILWSEVSVFVIRNHLAGGFAFLLAQGLGRVSQHDVEQDPFFVGDVEQTADSFFVEPAEDAAAQPFGGGGEGDVGGGDADVEQRELLVFDDTADAGREVGSLFDHKYVHGGLFGEVVHPQQAAGHGVGHLVAQLGFVDYDEVPRLGVAGRRGQAGSLDDAGYLFGLYRTVGVVLPVALPVGNEFINIGHGSLCFFEVHDAADVFADDVELEVDDAADFDLVEVGVFVGVGDDGHLEAVILRVAYGEAHAVDRYRALLDGHVAFGGHLGVEVVDEGVVAAAIDQVDSFATGCLVYVALHDVSVEAAVHEHAALEVHLVAYLERAQIGAVESLLYGGDGVAVAVDVDHGEAYAVVCDALVYLQFVRERTLEREVQIAVIVFECYDGSGFFDNS